MASFSGTCPILVGILCSTGVNHRPLGPLGTLRLNTEDNLPHISLQLRGQLMKSSEIPLCALK